MGRLPGRERGISAGPSRPFRRSFADPGQGSVSTRLGALFKPSLGLHMTSDAVIAAGADPAATPTAKEFIGVAESSGVLVWEDAACAASPRMLHEFLAAILTARADGTPDPSLTSLVESGTVLRYAEAAANLVGLRPRFDRKRGAGGEWGCV